MSPRRTTCKVCGRPLPDRSGKRGRPLLSCPPGPGATHSACARIDQRFAEISRLTVQIINEVGAESEDARRSLQAMKSYLWREANAATNRGGLVGTTAEKYTKKRSGWKRLA